MTLKPRKSLADETRHALDHGAGGTPVGDWAHSDEMRFVFTDPEDALGRIFNVLSAMRFQLIQIASEVDNLRASIRSAPGVEDATFPIDESGTGQ